MITFGHNLRFFLGGTSGDGDEADDAGPGGGISVMAGFLPGAENGQENTSVR
jgi:hypothetical protein